MHWLLTGLLLGGASWAFIGAGLAAVFGAWLVSGGLLLGAFVLLGTLLLLAWSSYRIRRARTTAATPRPEPGQRSRITTLPRRGQVA